MIPNFVNWNKLEVEKIEMDSHTYDIYLGTWNSQQTKTKNWEWKRFQNFSVFINFLSSWVNILKLGNSVLTEENLAKCDGSSIYALACTFIGPCQKNSIKQKKINSLVAFFKVCFSEVLPNGSQPEALGSWPPQKGDFLKKANRTCCKIH